jgi:hypothetical protein
MFFGNGLRKNPCWTYANLLSFRWQFAIRRKIEMMKALLILLSLLGLQISCLAEFQTEVGSYGSIDRAFDAPYLVTNYDLTPPGIGVMVNPQRVDDPEYRQAVANKYKEAQQIIANDGRVRIKNLLTQKSTLALMLGALILGWLLRGEQEGASSIIGKIILTEATLFGLCWAFATFPKNNGTATAASFGLHYMMILSLTGVLACLWAGKIAEVVSYSLIRPSTDTSPIDKVSKIHQSRAPVQPNKSSEKKKIVLTSPSLEGIVTAKPFASQRKESSRLGGTPLENAIAENRLGTAEELFQEQMKKEPANFDLFLRYLKFMVDVCDNKKGAQNAVQKKCREDVFTLEQMETASKEVNQARG